MSDGEPSLERPTFSQDVLVAGYREAIKQALTAADGAADTVISAAFGIATAYGALITLVTPEKERPPLLVALPFVLFAVAVVLGMSARLVGVDPEATNEVEKVDRAVPDAVATKRRLAWIAVAALALAVLLAGILAADAYGRTPAGADDPEPAPCLCSTTTSTATTTTTPTATTSTTT